MHAITTQGVVGAWVAQWIAYSLGYTFVFYWVGKDMLGAYTRVAHISRWYYYDCPGRTGALGVWRKSMPSWCEGWPTTHEMGMVHWVGPLLSWNHAHNACGSAWDEKFPSGDFGCPSGYVGPYMSFWLLYAL